MSTTAVHCTYHLGKLEMDVEFPTQIKMVAYVDELEGLCGLENKH